MPYTVKEIYFTLQGEGVHAGRAAVFCRFAGCNLWTGRETDRATARCAFCDTEFVGTDGPGGGVFETAEALAAAARAVWPQPPAKNSPQDRPFIVCTGGEPLLQLDDKAVAALKERGFEIAVETNGTLAVPAGVDWICVSPKAEAELVQTSGDELKLVFPQVGTGPELYERLNFRHFLLQPMDGPDREANTLLAAHYCMDHPQWRLSLQTHKLIGIP